MQCQGSDCKRTATCIPVVKIPAKNVSEDIMEPCVVVNNIPMCNRCVAKCELKDFLTDEVRARVVSGTVKNQPVDFSRAYMDRMRMSPKQIKELEGGNYATKQ